MPSKTLTAVTPVGTFTRKTASTYTHVVVWNSPRAAAAAADTRPEMQSWKKTGVHARWTKDHGHGVTWHGSLAGAQKASRKYGWDSSATLVGVFPVQAQP